MFRTPTQRTNDNNVTNDNIVIPPTAPEIPVTPPTQPPINYPAVDLKEILKKKAIHRNREERDLVREYSLHKKELQAVQE